MLSFNRYFCKFDRHTVGVLGNLYATQVINEITWFV